jgi:hypothetical protein
MASLASGSRMVNVEPLPSCDHRRRSPPWFCTTCLTMLRPESRAARVPRPGVVDAVEPLEHTVAFHLRNAGALVGDGDLDDTVGQADTPTPTRDFSGEYCTAFEMRLSRATTNRLVAVDLRLRVAAAARG